MARWAACCSTLWQPTVCSAQVGTGGTASRPLAVLSLLIAASRIARYRRGIRRRDCRARPSGEENLAQKSLLAGNLMFFLGPILIDGEMLSVADASHDLVDFHTSADHFKCATKTHMSVIYIVGICCPSKDWRNG